MQVAWTKLNKTRIKMIPFPIRFMNLKSKLEETSLLKSIKYLLAMWLLINLAHVNLRNRFQIQVPIILCYGYR